MHHDDLICACTALKKASRALTRFYDEALGESGMTIGQFALLRNIARGEPTELSRLADIMVMDRTSLYRSLAPLERAGWIVLEATGRGRARQASLTAAGRTAMTAVTPAWSAAQTRLSGEFGMDNWDVLHAGLARISALAQGAAR